MRTRNNLVRSLRVPAPWTVAFYLLLLVLLAVGIQLVREGRRTQPAPYLENNR